MAENSNKNSDEKKFANDFAIRLSKLREQKGVSARDMSLSLGQNAGYINSIENSKSLPSMTTFFYICEYLGVTPNEFFDSGNSNPSKLKVLTDDLMNLSDTKLEHISAIIKDML